MRDALAMIGLAVALTAAACSKPTPASQGSQGAAASKENSDMRLESPAFQAGGTLPAKFTCEGEDISPALRWAELPEGSESLALIVDDPDAPDPAAPKMTWVHWVLYDIPTSSEGLPEAVAQSALPPGTREGKNDWKRTGYGGPCPPTGEHRYFFKLYALDVKLGDLGEPTAKQLEAAMKGHVLAKVELIGKYEKRG